MKKSVAYFVLVSLMAGAIGGYFTADAVKWWYPSLIKPWFTPPSIVFGPVWTILYILMGLSGSLAWEKAKKEYDRISVGVLFHLQLILNIAWSFFFFWFQRPDVAMTVILALWCAIMSCVITFAKYSSKASNLLLPYLLWVSFASLLNYSVWQLNK